MTGRITRIDKIPSKFGGSFFYIFFKCEDGKSRRTCAYPKYRNFKFWRPFCSNPEAAAEKIMCEGLRTTADDQIDADYLSKTRLIKEETNHDRREEAKKPGNTQLPLLL